LMKHPEKGTPPRVLPGDSALGPWRGTLRSGPASMTLQMKIVSDIGGVVVTWDSLDFPKAFDVALSRDGISWLTAYTVTEGNGGRQYIPLGEQEAGWVRLSMTKSSRGRGYAFRTLHVKGADFSPSGNALFHFIAHESPPGCFPKYFMDRQSFWTLVGVSGDTKESLINEQGQIETDKMNFSLEPFLLVDGDFVTWHDVRTTPSLLDGCLPIPSVRWDYRDRVSMTVTAVGAGREDSSVLYARYRVENVGHTEAEGKLFVAVRPFQVDPPWQIFTMVGGAAYVDSISCDPLVRVNDKVITPLTRPSAMGAATFDQGDVTRYLRQGTVPPWKHAADRTRHASAALMYEWSLPPGKAEEFVVAVPYHDQPSAYHLSPNILDAGAVYARAQQDVRRYWAERLDNIHITLPPNAHDIQNALRANIAYILIHRDGPGIQPGSRSYERSWMRDGSMIGSALLSMGIRDEVRDYIEWYSRSVRPDGFVPCIVDSRGAEAVPEHDSHGQFLYLMRQYFLYSRDTTWLRGKWDLVTHIAGYITSLRAQRMTDTYRSGTPDERACLGLVPQSISHEGYSAKPMHSYWDNFFALRGLKDAAAMAQAIGEDSSARALSREVAEYRRAIAASVVQTMKNKNIDFVPGCVELGDKGGLSNTIIVSPVEEVETVPLQGLLNDLDQFWREYEGRKYGTMEWWAYLPYEWRYVDAFVHLGQKARATELFEYLMRDRRPIAWQHWAESVWKDPEAPKNIGDMPHAWAGSDFIRAVRSMLVFERERDTALVVGAGIPESWVRDTVGVTVRELPTQYGPLSYSMRGDGKKVVVELSGHLSLPSEKIVIMSPYNIPLVSISGDATCRAAGREITLRSLPAHVVLQY
jgi:hypothetical protein